MDLVKAVNLVLLTVFLGALVWRSVVGSSEITNAVCTVVFVGAVAWNSLVKARVLWLLSRRAVETGTLRGFWGDFLDNCREGRYSLLIALPIAILLFVILLVAVPLLSRRGRIAGS